MRHGNSPYQCMFEDGVIPVLRRKIQKAIVHVLPYFFPLLLDNFRVSNIRNVGDNGRSFDLNGDSHICYCKARPKMSANSCFWNSGFVVKFLRDIGH